MLQPILRGTTSTTTDPAALYQHQNTLFLFFFRTFPKEKCNSDVCPTGTVASLGSEGEKCPLALNISGSPVMTRCSFDTSGETMTRCLFKLPVIPGCQNDLYEGGASSCSSLSTEYTCSGVGIRGLSSNIQTSMLTLLKCLNVWGRFYISAAMWVLEDSGGRVCSRKCALTEGGGDSLPIRGVFSHRGF